MRYKTFGLLLAEFLFKVGYVAVVLWGVAVFFFKQGAKAAEAFKANAVAYFGNAKPLFFQQCFCFFQPFISKVLVRGFAVNGGKQPVEMVWRKAGLAAYAGKV